MNYDNDSLRKFLTILKKSLENTNFKNEKSLNELRTFYRYSCWQSLYDDNDTYKNLCKNIKLHEQYEFFKLESGVFLIYCCKNIFDNVFQEKGYKDLISEVKFYENLNENIKRKWAKLYPDSEFEPYDKYPKDNEKLISEYEDECAKIFIYGISDKDQVKYIKESTKKRKTQQLFDKLMDISTKNKYRQLPPQIIKKMTFGNNNFTKPSRNISEYFKKIKMTNLDQFKIDNPQFSSYRA